ncbi:MAG: metalloregulator ArsR/SmtB family transcription factor [Victivallaceae bacterium]|nr:metalloregulator ArsR/SmtB family transcription factor [Victivallaceae bacterium]
MANERKIAERLKAVAHPARLRILRFLVKGPSCATLTNREIDISQPNLSQHLKILAEAGIIDFRKIGTKKCFYISRPDFVDELFKLFDNEREKVILEDDDLRNIYGTE